MSNAALLITPVVTRIFELTEKKKKKFDQKIAITTQDTVNGQTVLDRWHSQISFSFSRLRVDYS